MTFAQNARYELNLSQYHYWQQWRRSKKKKGKAIFSPNFLLSKTVGNFFGWKILVKNVKFGFKNFHQKFIFFSLLTIRNCLSSKILQCLSKYCNLLPRLLFWLTTRLIEKKYRKKTTDAILRICCSSRGTSVFLATKQINVTSVYYFQFTSNWLYTGTSILHDDNQWRIYTVSKKVNPWTLYNRNTKSKLTKYNLVRLIPNKLLKQLLNFLEKIIISYSGVTNCWISITNYLRC